MMRGKLSTSGNMIIEHDEWKVYEYYQSSSSREAALNLVVLVILHDWEIDNLALGKEDFFIIIFKHCDNTTL